MPHDHEASQAREELSQVRRQKKDMAQSASAGKIYHASVASCSTEELAILPKESVLKRTINSSKVLPMIGLVVDNGVG